MIEFGYDTGRMKIYTDEEFSAEWDMGTIPKDVLQKNPRRHSDCSVRRLQIL